MITKITNGKLIMDEVCEGLDLYMEDGVITAVTDRPLPYDTLMDAEGNYVAPGFIDIHNHGGDGYEYEDGTEEAVIKSAAIHFHHGTTTLFPTLSATGIDTVYKAMEAIGVAGCVYVGDSEVDALTAKNAGVPCLSVLWGFRDREEIGNTHFCEKTEDLVEKLEEMIHGK